MSKNFFRGDAHPPEFRNGANGYTGPSNYGFSMKNPPILNDVLVFGPNHNTLKNPDSYQIYLLTLSREKPVVN